MSSPRATFVMQYRMRDRGMVRVAKAPARPTVTYVVQYQADGQWFDSADGDQFASAEAAQAYLAWWPTWSEDPCRLICREIRETVIS